MSTRSHPETRQHPTPMEGQPILQQRSYEIQRYGERHSMPLGIAEEALKQNIDMLNQLLADSITLYNLYKKHHWQVAGPTFYQLHLLLDKHAGEILTAIDFIAERIQTLGGVTTGMPFEVAKMTKIEHPPTGEEAIPAMLARTVNAHAVVIREVRDGIEMTAQNKDYGTNDMLMSDILRMHELHVWFISQHLIDTPIINSQMENGGRKG